MIDEIIKQLKPLINGKLIYLSEYGSHLYGLNTENSDLDFRGVYIPELDDIILKKDKDEINTELEIYLPINDITPTNIMDIKVDNIEQRLKRISKWDATNTLLDGVSIKKKVDVKIFSLQKFIQLCSKADTNALDLLFSIDNDVLEQYIYSDTEIKDEGHTATSYIPIWYIINHKNKLINTDKLESPITYAFKQATKYGLKGERYNVLENLLVTALRLQNLPFEYTVKDLLNEIVLDGKHLKITEQDNKGKLEKYLYVCGVEHQFNLSLDTFIERIHNKINKEYTSQRTINSADGNDWKALSHAIRVLLEVKELLDTGNIIFPCKNRKFLLDIKQGKVSREDVDNFFNQELSNILERVQKNELGWKYDEEFWNEFILSVYK